MAKVAVIYYSATGNVYKLARAVEEGAKEAGAEVRFRKVHDLAPEEAIKSNRGWSDHALMTEDVAEASLEDLEWADAYIFGTPTSPEPAAPPFGSRSRPRSAAPQRT